MSEKNEQHSYPVLETESPRDTLVIRKTKQEQKSLLNTKTDTQKSTRTNEELPLQDSNSIINLSTNISELGQKKRLDMEANDYPLNLFDFEISRSHFRHYISIIKMASLLILSLVAFGFLFDQRHDTRPMVTVLVILDVIRAVIHSVYISKKRSEDEWLAK